MRPSKRIRGIQEPTEAKEKPTKAPAAPKSKSSAFSHVEVPRLKDGQKQKGRPAKGIRISSSNEESDDGDEPPVRHLGRKVSKMAVYNVDSDSEEEKPSTSTKAKRVSKKARSDSPDFVVSDSDDGEDNDEEDSFEVSDEDSDAPKSKSKSRRV